MTKFRFVWLAALVFAIGGGAFAADEAAAPAAPAGAPDQAQIEKMKALMAPGEAHRKLEPFAGKWKYTSKFWMKPGAPAEETTGTADHQLVHGGRFLKQEMKGTWMGEPWDGTGYLGYDNMREEFQTVWIDSMSTALMSMTGAFDDASKTLTMSGTAACPMSGDKNQKMRAEWKIVDNDHNTFTMYMNGPDGAEVKGMEVAYERTAG